jgi:hypothetical protein
MFITQEFSMVIRMVRCSEGRSEMFLWWKRFTEKVQVIYQSATIKKILHKLKLIRSWFQDNSIFTFTASLMLLIYEGNIVTNKVDGVQPDMATAKIIDFGRVRRQQGGIRISEWAQQFVSNCSRNPNRIILD